MLSAEKIELLKKKIGSLKNFSFLLPKKAMVNRANLSTDANKKMEIGSSSDQDSSVSRSWSDLPMDLLYLILKRLGPIEFLISACVCKSWRSIAADARKKGFMESQPPLIVCIPKPADVNPNCHFYSLFHADGDRGSVVTYKRTLPSEAVGKRCVGFSCGYLFMQNEENYKDSLLLLVNPFTGHEFHFPSPRNRYCQFILATCIKPYPQFVVIAFSAIFPYLQFRRYGDDSWTIVNASSQFDWIEDVAVYEGKAYVLTRDARIGVLNLDSPPHLTMLKSLGGNDILALPNFLQGNHHLIAASHGQQLLLVDDCLQNIHKLDFLSRQWMQVKSLGDQALFLCDRIKNSAILRLPTKMIQRYMDVDVCQDGRYGLMNRDGYDKGFFLQVTGRGFCRRFIMGVVSSTLPPNAEHLYFWYFPSLSCNVDSIF